ncbi:twin-arginine translocation signal domain-containing protein, partial [Streptomyces rubrogriseus]|nr:twin-arginine translocation signal domain-containing protein [Streptomyces rubrogriseus]
MTEVSRRKLMKGAAVSGGALALPALGAPPATAA